jgi:hypothetical protein
MPNISETSVSDINLSRASSVMIIFFLKTASKSWSLARPIDPALPPARPPYSRLLADVGVSEY